MAESSRAPEAANSPSKTPTLPPAVPDTVKKWKDLAMKLDCCQTTLNGLEGSGPSKPRTDGFLKATNSSKIFAIIEAKADDRSRTAKPQVFWQETAEMVA
jgi:hypothetical protein